VLYVVRGKELSTQGSALNKLLTKEMALGRFVASLLPNGGDRSHASLVVLHFPEEGANPPTLGDLQNERFIPDQQERQQWLFRSRSYLFDKIKQAFGTDEEVLEEVFKYQIEVLHCMPRLFTSLIGSSAIFDELTSDGATSIDFEEAVRRTNGFRLLSHFLLPQQARLPRLLRALRMVLQRHEPTTASVKDINVMLQKIEKRSASYLCWERAELNIDIATKLAYRVMLDQMYAKWWRSGIPSEIPRPNLQLPSSASHVFPSAVDVLALCNRVQNVQLFNVLDELGFDQVRLFLSFATVGIHDYFFLLAAQLV
jgi:hypothetical protein